MKKVTNFIVDKRYFILVLFIALTIVSAIFSKNVKINHDIAKYLPDTSETRIGMNIMEKEFEGKETSTLNIMFENLSKEEKQNIKEKLQNIDGVKDIYYDDTLDYNKDKYTLYVVNVKDKSDSKLATKVYNQINEEYKDYTFYTSGDIAETNKTVLPFWIIALAVFSALIILIIMCESFVEPFLFLITILMAVILNKGTNIIFPNVSHITSSISAILQMALSMDYSIMLMNRYDQEKKTEKDKVKAMKKALHKAFQAISSSSVTTIVGLLALVFMSFKIGKDLGIILAKGVLFSLICIFFVLPSLILMFDKWIVKTKKKTPHIKLDKLGRVSYKIRYVSLPLFLIVLVTSFILKGNLGILYTDKQTDEISKKFTENNQMAILYQNKDEDKIAKYLENLEQNNNINEVLGYGNTINKKLTYDKLNNKLKDLGSETKVEDYLLKIIYYDYYNKQSSNKITLNDFLNFIENEAYNNQKINNKIDDNTKKDITRLKNFVIKNEINKKRTKEEIASILEIDQSNINDIFVYYLSKHNEEEITLPVFINFMNNDVLTNEKYKDKISKENIENLTTLSKFVNKNILEEKMNFEEIANLFGIDSDNTSEIFKYYILKNNKDTKMTISEFANFVLNNVLNDERYKENFTKEDIQNINLLLNFSNKEIINKEMNSQYLENLFGINKSVVKQILLLKYIDEENTNKFTIEEFINYVIEIKNNTNYLKDVDISILELLKNSDLIKDQTKYSTKEMSQIFNIDIIKINELFNLIDYIIKDKEEFATPLEFVNIIIDNINNENIKNNIDDDNIEKLKLLQLVMISSVNDKEFSYEDISYVIGIDINTAKEIYTLYIFNTSNIEITPLDFTSFILTNKDDPAFSNSNLSKNIDNLNLAYLVMNSTLNNQKYDSNSLSLLLGIDNKNINLLYGLYDFLYVKNNENYIFTLKEFVNFVINDVMTNSDYSSKFDNDKIIKLNTVNDIMNDSLNHKEYTSNEMFNIVNNLSNNIQKNIIEVLYIYYGSVNQYNNIWEMTVEEFVNYLNNDILLDEKFIDFIDEDMKEDIINAKDDIKDARELLIGKNYSRVVLNTNFDLENKETFDFINSTQDMLSKDVDNFYIIGDSKMAYEMSKTFNSELNFITIITMISIFIVVAITFKSAIIPIILVLIIQCAIYLTMGILYISKDDVYFIALLIVQSILMGATIDYAILYTSYYLEHRKTLNIKDSIINSYNRSIHTILTSSSILIIVTLIIASFTTAITAKICKTISQGTLCSTILILILLPSILGLCDKFIVKKDKKL